MTSISSDEALNTLKRLGCRVTMTDADCTVCLDDQLTVQSVERLPDLQTLNLMGKQIDDDQLGRLVANLPEIRTLEVTAVPVTGVFLENICKLPHVEKLTLVDTRIGHGELGPIGKMTCLKSLTIERTGGLDFFGFFGPPYEDDDLLPLAGLTELRELVLDWPKLAGPGLTALRNLGKLASLNLAGTAIGDASLEHLAPLTALKILSLAGTRVNGLAGLSRLANLEELDLRGAQMEVSDSGFAEIGQLSNLRKLLLISQTALSKSQINQLGKLPKLESLDLYRQVSTSWTALDCLGGLKSLYLADTGITDDDLSALTHLSKLEVLDLNGTIVSGAGLVVLQNMPELTSLNLGSTRVDDAGAANLRLAPKLRDVVLRGAWVSDAVFDTMKHLQNLHSLDLACIGPRRPWEPDEKAVAKQLRSVRPLTGSGIDQLAPLPSLQKLSLSFADVSDGKGLGELTHLKELSLDECHKLTEDALREVGRLTGLEKLNLAHSRLTDAGIMHLGGLTKLRTLNLHHTRASKAGMKQLQQFLPRCAIEKQRSR